MQVSFVNEALGALSAALTQEKFLVKKIDLDKTH
jgi:hypothetical protein